MIGKYVCVYQLFLVGNKSDDRRLVSVGGRDSRASVQTRRCKPIHSTAQYCHLLYE